MENDKIEQADQKPMKVCHHCGFLCKPNDKESKKWFPLEQTYAENNKKRSDLNTEQEPVAIADGTFNHNCPLGTPLYAAPVRTKDLTDDEIRALKGFGSIDFARAVIKAYQEKNK